jgi:hypothetical protein
MFGHRCAVDFGPDRPDLLRISWKPCTATPPFRNTSWFPFFECKTPIRQNETTRSWILRQAIKIYQIPLAKEMFVPVVPVVLLPIARFAMRVLSIGMCGCSTTLRCGNSMFAPVHRGMVWSGAVEMKKCTPVKCSNVSRSFSWITDSCTHYKRIKPQFLSHLISWSSQIEFSGIRGLLPI